MFFKLITRASRFSSIKIFSSNYVSKIHRRASASSVVAPVDFACADGGTLLSLHTSPPPLSIPPKTDRRQRALARSDPPHGLFRFVSRRTQSRRSGGSPTRARPHPRPTATTFSLPPPRPVRFGPLFARRSKRVRTVPRTYRSSSVFARVSVRFRPFPFRVFRVSDANRVRSAARHR